MGYQPTPAEQLVGRRLRRGWTVTRRFEQAPGATGGNFSTCYEAERDGEAAFVKAIDFHGILRQRPDRVMEVMQQVSTAYNHEVAMLAACEERRMDRVVRAIETGEEVIDPSDPLSIVFYFVFELADGDIRAVHDQADRINVGNVLRMLHDVAIAIQQLHSAQIAHQDIKPSNVLVFTEIVRTISRVADLGRASTPSADMLHDMIAGAGDPAYWTPEAAYGGAPPDWPGRRACDLYHLGSLLLFLFSGTCTTPALMASIQPDYIPQMFEGPFRGTFNDALPHLRAALQQICDDFPDVGDPAVRARLLQCFRQLCEPDPALRGHPKNRTGAADPYAVERFAAFFDLEARRASHLVLPRAA